MSQSQQSMISSKDALIRLSSIIILVAGIFQFVVGIQFVGMVNTGSSTLLTYVMLFIGGLLLIILSILEFAYEWVTYKLKPSVYTLISMGELIISYFIPSSGTKAALNIAIGNSIGMFGVFFLLIALRPNFGPTANKKIYQAVAGIMAFIISIVLLGLGIYVVFTGNWMFW